MRRGPHRQVLFAVVYSGLAALCRTAEMTPIHLHLALDLLLLVDHYILSLRPQQTLLLVKSAIVLYESLIHPCARSPATLIKKSDLDFVSFNGSGAGPTSRRQFSAKAHV